MPPRPKAPRTTDDPEGWEDDGLSRFLGLCEYNSRVIFDSYRPQWQLFDSLQGLLDEFVNELDIPDDTTDVGYTPTYLFMRSHAAYIGALRLVAAVHFVESYALMRSALENALYAFYFTNHPEATEAWLKRHEGNAGKEAARKASRIGTMLRYLKSSNEKLAWRASNRPPAKVAHI